MIRAEGENRPSFIKGAPAENFAQGILEVELPAEFGPRTQGKVREIWLRDGKRITVTTDRTSAFDRLICTAASKGEVLNLSSGWWFERTSDIVPNHMISIPHPNVLISKQAAEVIPVEVVVRAFMAKSSTSTSVYHNYADLGRRNIYGIDFPDGLRANERFPMGSILTPTTKAEKGQHDLELDEESTREIADRVGGKGTWDKIKVASRKLFGKGSLVFSERGLILVDTKYEFGIDENGELMVIDEIHTSDSSRLWKANTYEELFEKGQTPESFDKEILRRWLAESGFTGEGEVPIVDQEIIHQMTDAYVFPYFLLLLTDRREIATNSTGEIKQAIIDYFARN